MQRIVPAILALFLAAPTHSAGISSQLARPYIHSALNVISVMPQAWQQQIGRYLTSPDFSAAQLHQALNTLHEQSPFNSTHIPLTARPEQAQAIGDAEKSLEGQSPFVLAHKFSELNPVLAPYDLGPGREESLEVAKQARIEIARAKRQRLDSSLRRTAKALGIPIELMGLAFADDAAIASKIITPPGKSPQGWKLQAADKNSPGSGTRLPATVPSPAIDTTASAQDYYQILGVRRDASIAEIKSAFRKLAKKYHPDRNQGSRKQEANYRAVVEAYAVLGDPTKRAAYDRGERPSPQTSDSSEYVSASDPFVSRFNFHFEVVHAYSRIHPPTLTKDRKAILDSYVLEQERLYAAKQPDDILKHHRHAIASSDPTLNQLTSQVFFSLIGERAKDPGTQQVSDEVLQGFESNLGMDEFERFLNDPSYYRRLGNHADIPALYPVTAEVVLASLRDDGFDENPNGRTILRFFMDEQDLNRHPEFYEKIAERNPLLWRAIALQHAMLVSRESYESGAIKGDDLKSEVLRFTRLLKNHGREVDAARIRMIDSLVGAGERSKALLKYTELVEQALRIEDYSYFDWSRIIAANTFHEPASEKNKILERFLGSMTQKDPAVMVREMQEFESFLINDDRRRQFTEVAAFLDPYYAQAQRNLGHTVNDVHRLSQLTGNP